MRRVSTVVGPQITCQVVWAVNREAARRSHFVRAFGVVVDGAVEGVEV